MTRPSTQILALARMTENLATLYPAAIAHQLDLARLVDGYPSGGDGAGVRSTAELTSVEAAANAREHHLAVVADLEAGKNLLAITLKDMLDSCHSALRGSTIPPAPRLCDPAGKTGALIPLADGGWADYACRDIADKAGLCIKHYTAMRRWAIKQGVWRGDAA